MNNTKHTPGPWRTGDSFNTVFGPPNGNPAPEIIATVHKANRANAILIAATHDLLEACQLAARKCTLCNGEGKFKQALLGGRSRIADCPICEPYRAAITRATQPEGK